MSLKSFNGAEMTTTIPFSDVMACDFDEAIMKRLYETMMAEQQQKIANTDDPELAEALWRAMTDSLDRAIENEMNRCD